MRTNGMRVRLRIGSRRPSGAQTIVLWIICRATRLALTLVFRQAMRTRRDLDHATPASRRHGPLVAKAAWAAF